MGSPASANRAKTSRALAYARPPDAGSGQGVHRRARAPGGCWARRVAPLRRGGLVNYYALVYDVVEDFVARRAPYRTEHLELARAAHRRGELLLAGALGALLVFRAADQATAEDFARRDPYVTRGLVTP